MRHLSSTIDTTALYHGQRLTQALSSIHAKPITYVHAPMGYGKTVAVRAYLEKKKARPLWISVLTQDQDAFWLDFCNVLRRSLPEKSAVLDDLREMGHPSDPARMDLARGMIARLDFPSETVLVFDDVHLLPEPAVQQLYRLCLLLVRQGGFPHIVFISRHAPGQGLAEPLLKGLAAEVGPDFFILTREEIRAYFKLCGTAPDDLELEKLHGATGGWISALYLYLLHYTQTGRLAAPTALPALLKSQVFDRLRRETRDLLLALAPLESFTASQAKLFCEDAEAALADALRRNAFINYDPVTGRYVPHALFRDFLLKQFGALPAKRQQDACLRNAEWLIRHDEVRKAVRLLGTVKNSAEALELLNTVVDRLPVMEGNGLLRTLFNSFEPSLMDQYPGVMFRYAMAALSARDVQTFSDLLGRLDRHCASLPDDDAAANAWRGEMELLLALSKYNDILGMSVHHKRAAEFFRQSETRTSRLFGQDPWTLGSPSVLYMFHRESGALEETLARMRECMPHYTRLTGMHGAGAEDAMLAEVRFHAGEFESAAVAGHRALATAREHGQLGIEVCARFVLARVLMQQGEYDRSIDQLRVMRERVTEAKAFSLLQTVDLCAGLLHAAIHRPEGIPGWLLTGGEEKLYAFAGGCSYLALGGALLLGREYAELAGRFSLLLQKGLFSKNLLFTIHANLFISAGNAGLGLWAKAGSALLAALNLALPDKIYMPFVTNSVFLPHMKSLKDDDSYGSGVRRILRLSASFEKNRNGVIARFFPGDRQPLTPREHELVRLAMTGMPYREIAGALGLAPNSVKRYFAALFKKLGVNGREQLKHYFAEQKGNGF